MSHESDAFIFRFREVHDLCVLLGYGADAICPYLVFETLSMLRKEGKLKPFMNDSEIFLSYIAATARGISKVMAKMGISTLQSYKVINSILFHDFYFIYTRKTKMKLMFI